MKKEFLEAPQRDKINSTFYWHSSDTPENYDKSKTIYKPEDFIYKFNNYGFRCDDFNDWQNYPHRILYAGCSLTEGVGLPIDATWPKLFHQQLCQQLNIEMPFWSVAASATGTDQSMRYLYHIGKLLRPQIVIMYMSYLVRREVGDGKFLTIPTKLDKAFIKDKYVLYQTEKNLAMMNIILEDIDSYMLYNPCEIDFNGHYMEFSRIQQVYGERFQLGHNLTDLARDGWHPGPNETKNFADKMFEKCYHTVKIKLGL